MQITVNDSFQQGYAYELTCPEGQQFDPGFRPELSPKEMLDLGVFGGAYFGGEHDEFPAAWFSNARLSDGEPRQDLNYFGVAASQPLAVWQAKGWIYPEDPRGWCQWYCRYYLGRRIEDEDQRQIGRWKAIRRHVGAIKKNCAPCDLHCRPRQRQALLHWAYDSRRF